MVREIADSSAFSALAEYDDYLQSRFDLLATSQQIDPGTEFAAYFEENIDVLGKSVTLNSHSATGELALSDIAVLEQQLLEASELTVATKVIMEGIDLDKMIEKLQEALKLEDLVERTDAVKATTELAKCIEKLGEGLLKANDCYKKDYKPALTAYKTAYTDFESKAKELVSALKTAEDELQEGEEADSIYSKSEVKKAIKALKSSCDTYKEKAEALKKSLEDFKKNMEDAIDASVELPSKIKKVKDKVGEKKDTTDDWCCIIADQLLDTINKLDINNFRNKSSEEVEKLNDQIQKLSDLRDKTIKSDWDEMKIKNEYGPVKITSVAANFSKSIDAALTVLNLKSAVNPNSLTQTKNLLDIATQLLEVTVLCDTNLNATVNTGNYHCNVGMTYSSMSITNSITALSESCNNFMEGISNKDFWKVIKALPKLLEAVGSFFAAIITWIGDTFVGLIRLLASGPKQWYNSLLLSGYGAYNLPNRTTYSSESTVNGADFGDIYHMGGGVDGAPSFSTSLNEFAKLADAAGSDPMFKGAETEYLLCGSPSEIKNQGAVFFNLYMLRMVLDIYPVLKNPQLSTIAAATGPCAWIVKVAAVLAEPMLDTIILVNGGSEYLFKKTIYLSYSGIVTLQKDLAGCTGLSENLKNKIADTITAHNGTPADDGLFDASYTEHMIILLLTMDREDFLKRMQNLIQMEAAQNHRDNGGFDLDKAYTYVKSDVSYTLNPMFRIDGLMHNGLFTATTTQYCGY